MGECLETVLRWVLYRRVGVVTGVGRGGWGVGGGARSVERGLCSVGRGPYSVAGSFSEILEGI